MSSATTTESLQRLSERFGAELPARADALASAWAACGASLDDIERLEEIERLAHALAGTGATFGYERVSTVARGLEQCLNGLFDSGSASMPDPERHIDDLVRALSAAARAPADRSFDQERRAVAQSDQTRASSTLLLVDADSAAARALATEIEHFGYQVRVIDEPARLDETIEAAGKPDLLLLGVDPSPGQSPGQAWKVPVPDLPTIVLATRDDFDARLAAVRGGAQDYFLRPVDPVRLIDCVDRLTAARAPAPYRILVVEDDEALRGAYANGLRGAGMQVDAVDDPREVLERLDAFDPELILLDLYLPGCSGLELAKVIRQKENLAGIPIVFLSTEARISRQLLAMSLGGDDFLTKPIDLERLVVTVASRAARAREVRSFMVKDGMTGLLNQTSIVNALRAEVTRAERDGTALSMCLLDLDHFKTVNDTHGHLAGDRVIRSFARLLQQRLRQTDCVGRYGGEEFAVILPDVDREKARQVLDELRVIFASVRQNAPETEFSVTFSAGVAELRPERTVTELIDAADAALYRAKRAGRNRVEVEGAPARAADGAG